MSTWAGAWTHDIDITYTHYIDIALSSSLRIILLSMGTGRKDTAQNAG